VERSRSADTGVTVVGMPRRTPPDDARLAEARRIARGQGQVLSRPQLYSLGITRWEVRGEVRAGRWQLVGDQSVCLHNHELGPVGEQWAAVFQGGPRAQLDGASSLQASGLDRFTVDRVRVSVPRGARVRRNRRFNIRQTRRWSAADRVESGIPRTQVPVAAVRGALWARTDREATYLLSLVVQQGLARPEQIGHELLRIRRDKRRLLLHAVVNDLLGGARSLGEIDVGRELRRRGLPEPARQILRRDRANRYYLDLYWPDLRLVVEVDGIHHSWAENVVGDALRQNALALDGDVVLRVPLLGLRLQPEEFYDQIELAIRTAGWAPAAA
jgi:very-short-patch-repair endonuclease